MIEKLGKQIYEARFEWADGIARDVLLDKVTFSNEDGSPRGLVGMALEKQLRVFDIFSLADKDLYQNSGLKIGMSIAKSIIDAHWGRANIESKPREGSCVRVSFPLIV